MTFLTFLKDLFTFKTKDIPMLTIHNVIAEKIAAATAKAATLTAEAEAVATQEIAAARDKLAKVKAEIEPSVSAEIVSLKNDLANVEAAGETFFNKGVDELKSLFDAVSKHL
jgi:hypothetical protein